MCYLLEGLIYRGEFAFQNPTGLANSWTEIYVIVLFLLCFIFYFRAISKYELTGPFIRRGDLTEGFLRYDTEGLIFRNFTVPSS